MSLTAAVVPGAYQETFLALLPQPAHRDFYEICIEHLYTDEDLMRKDANGRRIYFAREFDKSTGAHLTEPVRSIKVTPLKQPGHTPIVDGVWDSNDHSMALSKKDFALAVLNRKPTHADVSFEGFKAVFEMFEEIRSCCKLPLFDCGAA